ncbi:TadE family protein [Actinomadura scrupuli]|uniref:TadE family protein n=1 Tax=Actinomadura scrupuli TaxID=559629 RepID=UPI003D9791E6
MTRRRLRGPGADRGTMSLELVIVTPVFIGFMMLLAGFGRIVDVQSQIDGAARDAARAASVARGKDGPGGARSMAERAAVASLGGDGWCSGGPKTTVDVSDWGPGGQVTATVSCSVDLGDVAWIGIPGTKSMRGSATAPIDRFTRRDGSVGTR